RESGGAARLELNRHPPPRDYSAHGSRAAGLRTRRDPGARNAAVDRNGLLAVGLRLLPPLEVRAPLAHEDPPPTGLVVHERRRLALAGGRRNERGLQIHRVEGDGQRSAGVVEDAEAEATPVRGTLGRANHERWPVHPQPMEATG